MDNIRLDIKDMDEKHDAFVDLLRKIQVAPKEEFLLLFKQMIEHTKEHFAFEETLMRERAYYGLQEHLDEHENLLEEMEYFFQKAVKMPPFGYSYINEYAYDKFKRHIINIDSQLAMFLKEN